MSNEIANVSNNSMVATMGDDIVNINQLVQRANSVKLIKKNLMVENVHFGKIPGCGDKPTLLKNGAELLCMAFKLASSVEVKVAELGGGHREYTVTTILSVIGTGEMVASGIGCCSTMESKYRYRGVEKVFTDTPLPKDYWDIAKTDKKKANELIGGAEFCTGKNNEGKWVICKKAGKMENPDIADVYNTVLKMAAKRSLIDATLKATGGSCEFTQDLEDIKENESYQSNPQPTYYEEVQPTPPPSNATTSSAVTPEDLARYQTWAEDQKDRIGREEYDATVVDFGGLEKITASKSNLSRFMKTIKAKPDMAIADQYDENDNVPF